MTRSLGDTLRQLADDVPDETLFPPDLYHRSRRTHRRRVAATAAAATVVLAGVVTGVVVSQGSRSGATVAAAGGDAERTGLMVDHWITWLGLAVTLAAAGLWWWRRSGGRGPAVAILAAAGAVAVVITTAPPGIAWWGEPSRAPGLPDRVVTPSTWTARATDSPPGRAAILFGGSGTRGDIEEGRVALVAGDGERYRVLEQAMYEDPGESSFLSPDGRYVSLSGQLIDLTTGAAVRGQPSGVVIAWSADSTRYLYRTPDRSESPTEVRLGVWDLAKRRGFDGPTVPVTDTSMTDELVAALSPDGTRFAVQERGQPDLRLYRVGERAPYRTLPVGPAQLGGSGAWTRDGRAIALAAFSKCTRCPLPWWPSQWQLTIVDATSGQPLAGRAYPALASVTHLRVLGWRSDDQPVVAVGDPERWAAETTTDASMDEMTRYPAQLAGRARVLVLSHDNPPEPLLSLPASVEDIDIAADYLTKPVHEARPATFGPPSNPWLLASVGCSAVTLTAIVGVAWGAIRQRRRRSGNVSPASQAR